MRKIIRFIVSFLIHFLPKEDIQTDKRYSEAEISDFEKKLGRLLFDVKKSEIACRLVISTDPNICICPTKDYSSKLDFWNPKKNSSIFVEFYYANGVNEPLFNFWVGKNKCILEQSRKTSRGEMELFKKILPLNFIETDPEEAFILFSKKINFIIDLTVKKTKINKIILRENEFDRLPKKENSDFVLNEKRRIGSIIKNLKIKFNEEYGHTFSI